MFEWIDSLPLVPAIGILLVIIYARAGGTYLVGRTATRIAERGRTRSVADSVRVQRAIQAVHRYGAPVVALSFLTIGFQTACNLAAGVVRMPLRAYLPALLIGGFAWAVIYATVGLAAFSLWWRVALANPWAAGFLALAAVAALTWFILRRRAARRATQIAVDRTKPDDGVNNNEVR